MPLWKQNEKSLQALFFLHVNAALMLQMANKYPSGIGGGGGGREELLCISRKLNTTVVIWGLIYVIWSCAKF